MKINDKRNIIIALDGLGYDDAMRMAEQLPAVHCRVKVGKALFTRCGPKVISTLHDLGHDIFLDLKYHDIPNTVAEAVDAAADLGVWMVNVHAQGGGAMLRAAKDVLRHRNHPPLLIAVTVLTSMSEAQWQTLGCRRSISEQVQYLTALTVENGLNGVVCSAHEAAEVKAAHGSSFITVTPGVRPVWAQADDQSRIMTPAEAIQSGSDYLVIGRPITRAGNPHQALIRILQELYPNSEEFL